MNRRILLSVGLTLLLLIVIVGAFIWRSASTNRPATTTTGSTGTAIPMTPMKLALDFTPNPNHTGIFVAQQKGWYRQQGIDLTILPFSQNAFPDVLVGTGKADVGISGTESVVLDAGQQQQIVSLATITAHNTSYIVVRDDSTIKQPKDLDGKKFGGYGAPYEGPIMTKVIQHDGGKGSFKTVTLGTDAIQALSSKQVDFAWVFSLDIVAAEHQGVHLRKFTVTDYGVPDYYSPTIITSKNNITQKADLLRRFMKATAQGYDFARTNPDEAAQLLISGNQKGTFPDTALVTASQKELSPLYTDSGRAWGVQNAQAWQGYVDFILPTKSVTDAANKPVSTLDSASLFTNDFLPKQ